MEGKTNMADGTDEGLPAEHVPSLKGSALSSSIFTEKTIHESVHTIQKKKNVSTELVDISNVIFTQSQISPCQKNQAIEATSPKLPNIPLRRKSHSNNRENPSESMPAVRKKSIADITSKEEQVGETLAADFGHKLILGNAETDNKLYEFECCAEESKQQSIPSPKLFRRRKSLVKDGEFSEQSSSLEQQQNLIGKTDNIEMKMSQSKKKSVRKKALQKKIEENHLLLHTQTVLSNSRIADGKTKIDRWHERKNSNVCNVNRENYSLDCQQRSDITKVANENVRRKSMINYAPNRAETNAVPNVLQRRKSVGIIDQRGMKMSISDSGQAFGNSVRRTSEVTDSNCSKTFQLNNRYANGKEVACKSTKVIRKKKKKKRVSRAEGRPAQQSYNESDSSDHQRGITDNSVVSRTTQESTASSPKLARDFEAMNIQTPIRRRSRLMTSSAKYNDEIGIQCQSGDSDTVIPESGLCDNAYIDSHQHIDNMKAYIPPFEPKERKSIQDSNGIERQKSRSPRVRKRTKYIEEEGNKRTNSLSPLELQRKQPIHIDDNKNRPSDCPRAQRNNSNHTPYIGRVASLSPLARQRGRSVIQNADDVSPQGSISPIEHRAIQGADVLNRHPSTSPRLRQRKAIVQYNDCVKKVAPISPLAKEPLRDYIDVASPPNSPTPEKRVYPQDAEKEELSYQGREPVQDMDLKDLTDITPVIRYRRKSRQDIDMRGSPSLQRKEIPIQYAEHETQINRSPLVQRRMQTIHDTDHQHQMTTSRKIPQSSGPDSDTRESTSITYARQRRRSCQEVDVNNQLSMSPSLRRRRKSIQDINVNNQLQLSPSMRRRRKSIQDVDFHNQQATSPYLGQRTPIGAGIDIQQCMSPSAIMSKGGRQRRKSIQDVDFNTQVVMSPNLRHRRISMDSDVNSQQFGISTSASMPQGVRQRKQSIQDVDVNSQLPVSPSMRRRRKSVQDIACVGRRTSIGADTDSGQCISQTMIVSKGARQRRKSIQDVDLNTQIATSTYEGRRTSIDADINSQFCMSPFLSQGVRQRSIQDVDNTNQLPISPRLRHRRKSVQEAVDLKMQSRLSPIIRRKLMSFGDHKDGITGTCGYPNQHDINGNASLGNMSHIVRQRRKSFQDADDAMKYASFSPRLQRRTSINDNDENKALMSSPSYLQGLKNINPHQYDMQHDPCISQKYMSEDEINMAVRSRPRRASLQEGDRMMPLSPNSLLHRSKYYTDMDGAVVHQSFSPSLQRRRQMYALGGREDCQKGFQRSPDYCNLGSPGSETLLTHPVDDVVLVSGGQPVADSKIDEDDPVKPERKRSLSLSKILDKEMSDQLGMLRSATSATVLSFNRDVTLSLDGQISPSPGRESKSTLIQKNVREKLEKSARRSSFPAVLDPLSVGTLSGLKGRNMEIKPIEQTDNFGPFSRRARKASLISNHSQSQTFQDKDLEKPRLKRKTSLPVGMLTHVMQQEHEVVAHDLSYIKNAANPVSCKHKTRRMSQDREEMATSMACQNTDNFGGARRKTRRMSLPDTLMFSNIADFSVQSFCHQIPENIRRVPGAKYIQNPFEQQSNLCLQRPINPCGDDTNFPGDDFANTMRYPPISNKDLMLDDEETLQMKEGEELEGILQCQTPVVSPVISDLDEDKKSEQDVVMPCLSRQDSIISDVTLPPRTPEPEVMAEFSHGNVEGIQADAQSYKPRYCWCTRCKLMYRMYKDDDSVLESWGNYPCFKF